MAILELAGVSAGYGPVRVLHDVNLSVNPGERLGLVGLNGHGENNFAECDRWPDRVAGRLDYL